MMAHVSVQDGNTQVSLLSFIFFLMACVKSGFFFSFSDCICFYDDVMNRDGQ